MASTVISLGMHGRLIIENIERNCSECSDLEALLTECGAENVEDEEFDYARSLAEEMYDDLLTAIEIIQDEQLSGEFEWDGNPDWAEHLYAHRCRTYPHLKYLFDCVF